jgi:hypothetical protein
MKSVYLFLLLLCAKAVQAHEPDLSNLMIYEQNGKCLLVIKSSLTAFEGEIDYLFGKNAYKSPEAFQQLVIKHFQNNCLVMMNGDTVKLINPTVLLGHESTLIAELLNTPNKVNSIYIRNRLFKDMPSNMCEIILTLKGLPQKQYILDNANKQEVKLTIENNNWTVVKAVDWSYKNPSLVFGLVFLGVVSAAIIVAIRKNKK